MVIKVNPHNYETFARWLDKPYIPVKVLTYLADNTSEEDKDYFLTLDKDTAEYLKENCPFPFIYDRI